MLLSTPYPAVSATGVGSFVRMHSEGLRRRGVEVFVVAPSTMADPKGIANLLLAVRSACEFLRRRRVVDVVHCQQLHVQSLAMSLLGRTLGKGVVLTVHGRSPIPEGIRGSVFRAMEHACQRTPHRLVFVARSLQEALSANGTVIPNGVPVEPIRQLRTSRGAIRRELGLDSSFVLLFVGRVTKDKGIPTLLEAFDIVQQSARRDLRLVLVGPVDPDLRAPLESRVRSGGAISVMGEHPDPRKFLVAADVFILPSMREGLPLSVLEAMAAGLPVVATRVGDVPRILEEGKTGLLIPPGDPQALAGAIAQVVSNPSRAALLAHRGVEAVAAKYDIDQMVVSYLRLYGEVAS